MNQLLLWVYKTSFTKKELKELGVEIPAIEMSVKEF